VSFVEWVHTGILAVAANRLAYSSSRLTTAAFARSGVNTAALAAK